MKNYRIHKHSLTGFTLIELLMGVALLGILLALGVPNFTELLKKNTRAATLNEALGFFQFARSEAIKRGITVTLCKSTDGAGCVTTGHWEGGWLVFIDPDEDAVVEDNNGDGAIAYGVEILKVKPALESGNSFRAGVNHISYLRNGTASATTSFTYCDNRGAAEAAAIILRATGQQKTAKVDAGGSALVCPA